MCVCACVGVHACVGGCGCVHLGRISVQYFQCLILSSYRLEPTKNDIHYSAYFPYSQTKQILRLGIHNEPLLMPIVCKVLCPPTLDVVFVHEGF